MSWCCIAGQHDGCSTDKSFNDAQIELDSTASKKTATFL